MGIFRKTRSSSGLHPVTAFWTWWISEGHRVSPHTASSETDVLTERLRAIHPELTWHFGAGVSSEHCLTVSAGGNAEARPAAERWLRGAPSPDATWEFRSSQRADPQAMSAVLEIAGRRLDLSATQFRVEPVAEELRVHVGVYHPVFPDLPEDARGNVAFLVLDWLLGEDDVERWLGHVEPLASPPVHPQPSSAVQAAVRGIEAQRDPDEWVLAQWQAADGSPGLAMFRRGLRWVDHATLDRHQTVSFSYPAKDDGLPRNQETLEDLRQLQDELELHLGQRGLLVAVETISGRRTFHAYTDGEDQNVDDAIIQWARSRKASIDSQPDPGWLHVRHFTG